MNDTHIKEQKVESSFLFMLVFMNCTALHVFMKGERVLQDFNIQKEAGGSNRALMKTFEANVTNTVIDIHFRWAGRGTCCIPFQSTYGPLVSAIHVMEGSMLYPSSGQHSLVFSFPENRNLFITGGSFKQRSSRSLNNRHFLQSKGLWIHLPRATRSTQRKFSG